MTYAQLTLFGWAMYAMAFLGAVIVLWDGRKTFARIFSQALEAVGMKCRHPDWSWDFCWFMARNVV